MCIYIYIYNYIYRDCIFIQRIHIYIYMYISCIQYIYIIYIISAHHLVYNNIILYIYTPETIVKIVQTLPKPEAPAPVV